MLIRLATACVAAVVALCAARDAALATVFSAAITPGNQDYSGACPGTVHFGGTIFGTPGQAVTYQFFGPGYGNDAAHNDTIPGSASLSVGEDLSVNSSNQGSFKRQILVTAGAQVIYSNMVTFSVTCTSVAPTPSSAPGGLWKFGRVGSGQSVVKLALAIPAPYGVKTTNDVTECGRHLGGLSVFLSPVCGEVLAQGGADIIFKWDPSPVWPSIDGFRAYTADSHVLDSKITSSAGGSTTVLFKRPPLPSTCYVVRAYKASTESADSNQVCFYPSTTKAVWLNPQLYASHFLFPDFVIDYNSQVYPAGGSTVLRTLLVGHYYRDELDISTGPSTAMRVTDPSVSRAGFFFDLEQLHAHFIFKAVLHLGVSSTDTNTNPNASTFPSQVSCLYEIAPGASKWFNGNGQVDGDWNQALRPAPTMRYDLDVTSWARPWLNGQVNYGIAMRGYYEDRNNSGPSRCDTWFNQPQLEVTYN